uniref:Retinol dehydrogenase 13 n=1 Tax=Neogobius melanostomus TaxID=47308 RepID=A0A8C6WVR5_9GOBI
MVLVLIISLSVAVLRRWISGGRCRSLVRLDGKTAIVTGANTGIGKETCRDFAPCHHGVPDLARGEAAAEEIRVATGNGNVVVRHLDLASLFSVRQFCSEILQTEERVDLLVNNAGVMMCPKWMTEDGFETQLAVNHLGHFLLTNQLLPKLKSSAPVVNVSSVDVDDLFFSRRSYTPLRSYRQSKLANVLFTRELSRRLRGSGVSCFSLHPGVIRTELGRHVQTSFPLLGALLSLPALLLMKTPHEGAQTSIYCAVTAGLESKSGAYFSDCAEKDPAPEAKDDETALKLWNESCRLVGLNQD